MLLMDDVNKWLEIYRKLDQVSPEVFDCGRLCGAACCVGYDTVAYPDSLYAELDWESEELPEEKMVPLKHGRRKRKTKKDLGIYLLPGEHQLLDYMKDHIWLDIELQDPKDCKLPASWEYPVYFVNCIAPPHCPRKWRPIQCRTFPLKPVFDENGVLEMIWEDEELPYTCPLIEHNAPIHDDFYRVTYEVWTELVQDPRIFDLVMSWS